ncbi:ERF family protein [Xanthobacter sp. VTT E-85241]|uniref:ERF family protein n=1 Tax=Roseixanthobacter finlandensis TaxID=3119922 RepID=UPI0037279F72
MKNIAAALLKVQHDLDPVKKGKKGHNNKYADLPAVLDEAISTCNTHGIVVLQPIQPASRENHARVETILLHADSGEMVTGAAEVPWRSESKMNDAQSYGSAVTYARRYSLVSALGISTEDDDGQSAHARPAKTQPTTPAPRGELSLEEKTAKAIHQARTLVEMKPADPALMKAYREENAKVIERCRAYPEAAQILEDGEV